MTAEIKQFPISCNLILSWFGDENGNAMLTIENGDYRLKLAPLQAIDLAANLTEMGLSAHRHNLLHDCDEVVRQ